MRRKLAGRQMLASPYLLWMIGFTIIPLVVIVKKAFTDPEGNFTFDNFLAIGEPINLKSFIFSLEIAIGCTLICILLAYPLVMALRKIGMSRGNFTLFFLILPMWMNFVLRILAWQMILSNNGILNLILTSIHLPAARIANTPAAIMIGVVYDYFPYMMLPIFTAVSEIDEGVIESAKDLGANGFTTFRKVILPLSMPGLKSGITMVFVPSMTSFVIADLLGGGKLQLIGNIIEQEFSRSTDWGLGSGLSVFLMAFILLTMAFSSGKVGIKKHVRPEASDDEIKASEEAGADK